MTAAAASNWNGRRLEPNRELPWRETQQRDPLLDHRPDAMLARKSRGTGAVLAYRGHLLTENRNGLVVSTLTTQAYGSAERDAALLMAESLPGHTPGHARSRQRL